MTRSPDLAEFDHLMQARQSCRAFRPDPVPRAVIEGILAAAQKIPSWCNAQPWQVDLTSGAETDRLRAALQSAARNGGHAPDLAFPTRYAGSYQDRRRNCGWQLYQAVGIEKGDRAGSARQMLRNFDLFDAPHCAVISSPVDLGGYGAMDCGGYVTAFTLAAQSAGVASIPQAAVASFAPLLHDWFDIGSDRLILCAISFGYAETADPANGFRTDRAPLAEVVRWHG